MRPGVPLTDRSAFVRRDCVISAKLVVFIVLVVLVVVVAFVGRRVQTVHLPPGAEPSGGTDDRRSR
jgi:hypothetical protein